MKMPVKRMFDPFPGILICFVIAMPAWFFGTKVPEIGGPTIAIFAGIVIATIFPRFTNSRENIEKGVKFTSKRLLQYSIILLGFSVSFQKILHVGGQSLVVMIFTLSAAFLVAFVVGKSLKLPNNTTTLIGVGTSICGGSAIAATAPIIKAKDGEVARAISTIFLFNIIAVFIFPALGHMIGLSDTGFGMWAGTAINDTSSVVAAGTSWSAVAGNNDALNFATIVKLTRTLMIVPITLVLALYMARKSKQSGSGDFKFRKIPMVRAVLRSGRCYQFNSRISGMGGRRSCQYRHIHDHHGHGRYRAQHKSEDASIKRVQAHFSGIMLLVRCCGSIASRAGIFIRDVTLMQFGQMH